MANCKFCGKPVRCASVHHTACWEKKANEVAEKFCDNYCRFPRECSNEEELQDKHCDNCVMIKLLNIGL